VSKISDITEQNFSLDIASDKKPQDDGRKEIGFEGPNKPSENYLFRNAVTCLSPC
jgi:hypothetical protein